jgi:polysaccharide deacetylase 2 family uncharacterized protein YibQ
MRLRQLQQLWIPPLLFLMSLPAQAGVIGIIIDDIGYNYPIGLRSAGLHPAVTLSILPEAPFAKKLAANLNRGGHEVMLHLPMQAELTRAPKEPVVLTENMQEDEFKTIVENYLHNFPEAHGVNNHMGSLLTQKSKQMEWLMEIISAKDFLYFIDSRTHKRTVAENLASQFTINTARRTIFLDQGRKTNNPKSVWKQVRKLQQQANLSGFALAIAHPRSDTLAVLSKALPWLESQGHTIVPISRYIQLKEEQQCPECSSHSLKVVKNSKR